MKDLINFHRIIGKDNGPKLLGFFQSYKKRIHAYLRHFLHLEPQTAYQKFILNNAEGTKRTLIYLDCFEAALGGKIDIFLEDQKRIGYIRAIEGYHLNDVYKYTVAFKEALWKASGEYNAETENPAARLNNDDIITFNKLLDGAYYQLSFSFLQTRDEIIRRHRNQLHALQRFTASVVSIFEEKEIRIQTIRGIHDVFGLDGTFLFIENQRPGEIGPETTRVVGFQLKKTDIERILEQVRGDPKLITQDGAHSLCRILDSRETNHLRFVASPILDRKFKLNGILCVHDRGRAFRFSKFDENLLHQFSYFVGAVSANSRMVSEIAEKKATLSVLASRLISVQEEERKKIAADIHDVLTQALTGIGYMALYCMEIAGKDTDLLHYKLEQLTETINDVLRQSRQIISNLRPHILDDLGVIAAFGKLIRDFEEKYDIKARFRHPDSLQINPDKGIVLFRILQEALHNVRRHSAASEVEITLCIGENGRLQMKLNDNGRGFDIRQYRRRKEKTGSGLGLLTMRERAEELKAELRVESRPGDGCTVLLDVPMERNL